MFERLENEHIKVFDFPIRESLFFIRRDLDISWWDEEIQTLLLSWGVIFPPHSIPIRLLTYNGNINRIQFGTADEEGIGFERPTEDNTMSIDAIDGLIKALQVAKQEIQEQE